MPRVFLLGRRPKPSLLFLIAEKDPAGCTLQAAPCGPPSAGQTYFEPGVLQPFILGAAPQTCPSFSHCRKRRQKG